MCQRYRKKLFKDGENNKNQINQFFFYFTGDLSHFKPTELMRQSSNHVYIIYSFIEKSVKKKKKG